MPYLQLLTFLSWVNAGEQERGRRETIADRYKHVGGTTGPARISPCCILRRVAKSELRAADYTMDMEGLSECIAEGLRLASMSPHGHCSALNMPRCVKIESDYPV